MKRMLVALALGLVPSIALAQSDVQISGLADFVVRNAPEEDVTNLTFGGYSNLDNTRLRVFLDAVVSENVQFFTQTQILNFNDILLYSAYARFANLAGPALNLHLGLIPTTVGTYAARTYSDRNPLVGTPLLQNHHTVLNPHVEQKTVDDLLAQRDTRRTSGLPVIYDNCWNTGIEAFGELGDFDYSVGLLSGSLSLPTRNQSKELPQVTGRVAWVGGPQLKTGISGYAGPYLIDGLAGITYSEGRDANDYLSGGVGWDFYGSTRFLEVHSEIFHAWWEHPDLPTLKALSGYVDAKYKLRPGWFAAARVGFLQPNEVRDAAGASHPWDYPVRRLEYGFGYRPAPRIVTKLVAQHNRFDGKKSLDRDHFMVQVSTGF